MDQAIRVLIVESEPLFRRGLAGSVRAAGGFDVVAEVSRRDDAFRVLETHAADVILLGTITADGHPVQVAADLHHHYPASATIVISMQETDDELFAAIRAGASAYCGRDIDESDLYDLIRRSADGEFVINEQLLSKPYVAARVLDQFRNTSLQEQRMAGTFMPLTERELEILKKVSAGLTNAEIGYSLGISAQTVKNHVTSILRKLAVNDRTQAVVTALRHGWLSIDDEELNGSVRRVASNGPQESSATADNQHRDH